MNDCQATTKCPWFMAIETHEKLLLMGHVSCSPLWKTLIDFKPLDQKAEYHCYSAKKPPLAHEVRDF